MVSEVQGTYSHHCAAKRVILHRISLFSKSDIWPILIQTSTCPRGGPRALIEDRGEKRGWEGATCLNLSQSLPLCLLTLLFLFSRRKTEFKIKLNGAFCCLSVTQHPYTHEYPLHTKNSVVHGAVTLHPRTDYNHSNSYTHRYALVLCTSLMCEIRKQDGKCSVIVFLCQRKSSIRCLPPFSRKRCKWDHMLMREKTSWFNN